MISETLSMWGNGAVTLPKEWRSRYETRHFIAVEVPQGLLIQPILDVVYAEGKDGSVSLRFPMGIEAGALADRFEAAVRAIGRSAKKRSKGRKGRTKSSSRR